MLILKAFDASLSEKSSVQYLSRVLELMQSPDEALLIKVNEALTAILEFVQKESQYALVPMIRQAMDAVVYAPAPAAPEKLRAAQVNAINLFKVKGAAKNIIPVLQNSIMYGSAEVRADAAACIAMVAEYSTLEAI